jgi:hypothetical protein
MKEEEMGRACGTYWEKKNAYTISVGKEERRSPVGRTMHRWEGNLRVCHKEI